MKEIINKEKHDNVVCGITDKSSKFFIMKKDSYKKEVEIHAAGDNEIDIKEVKDRENKINHETLHWKKMFNIGKNWKQDLGINSALRSTDCQVPPLTILIKDHKKFRDDGTLPGRPLCWPPALRMGSWQAW